jgi:hypothetical protein
MNALSFIVLAVRMGNWTDGPPGTNMISFAIILIIVAIYYIVKIGKKRK